MSDETSYPLDRRALLGGALAYLALPASGAQAPEGEARTAAGLIVRSEQPQNLEFPFAGLDRYLVPAEQFYVRNHFPAPALSSRDWRLRVEGAVERPLALDFEALRRLPARRAVVTLECAGNGRSLLVPPARGVTWALGAVGNAAWEGVPLGLLLERAGVRPDAVDVVLEGADGGELRDEPKPPGPLRFARSIPLAKARRDVLLAYRMNDAPLPPAHGSPVRAVVPGWYGMASVKWLTRILVLPQAFRGYYQAVDYAWWTRRQGLPQLVPITEMQVKAQIARPTAGERVPAGRPYRVFGAAWTGGEAHVERVEVSADGGRTWSGARLLDPPVPHAWRRWEWEWRVTHAPGAAPGALWAAPGAAPGHPAGRATTLMARATDSRRRTQPAERDPDRRNYAISHVLPVAVEVTE